MLNEIRAERVSRSRGGRHVHDQRAGPVSQELSISVSSERGV